MSLAEGLESTTVPPARLVPRAASAASAEYPTYADVVAS